MNYRPARPTLPDAQAFSALYAQATFNMMQLYLGDNAYAILERLFPMGRHEHSCDITTFAESEGWPIGLLIGYSAMAHRRISQRTLNLYVRYGFLGLLQSVPTIVQLRPLRAVTGRLPSDAYYVKGLAVAQEYRRQGIARKLLQEADTRARQSDCKRLILDVRTHNAAALALYQNCGYQIVAETPSLSVSDETIAFYRMEKGL